MRLDAPRRRRALISLTPLVDVVMILLIFFMLATSFLDWHAIEVGARGAGSTGDPLKGSMLIRVHRDGSLDLNGRRQTLEGVSGRLQRLLESRPDQAISVQPGRGTTLQRVVTVLDRLRRVGAHNVSLVTR